MTGEELVGMPGTLTCIPPTAAERLFSGAALERAWLAVKRAGGGAGVDRMTLAQFETQREEELGRLRRLLVQGEYRPRPVRVVFVPKASGGLRALALWTLRDRVAQRVVYDILAPVYEPIFLACSFGFRVGLGTAEAVAAVVRYRAENRRWVVRADVEDCFDRIDGRRLLGLVRQRVHDPLLLRYVEGWLTMRVIKSLDGAVAGAGASQGNVLSPLLANIYLHEVDRLLVPHGLAYVRYADDLVVCCRRKGEAEQALVTMRGALGRWGLAVNERKRWIGHFDEGFAFLGYFFVGHACYRLSRGR